MQNELSEEDHDALYRRGKASLKAVNKTWVHWQRIGEVLLDGRRWAMRTSNSNAPNGRRYSDAFQVWLNRYKGFRDEITEHERADLLKVMDNPEIMTWRGTDDEDAPHVSGGLPPERRRRLQHPTSILNAFRAHQKAHDKEARKQKADKAVEDALKADNGLPLGVPFSPPAEPPPLKPEGPDIVLKPDEAPQYVAARLCDAFGKQAAQKIAESILSRLAK